MGRIDEALKRAAATRLTVTTAPQELFVSAWSGAKPAETIDSAPVAIRPAATAVASVPPPITARATLAFDRRILEPRQYAIHGPLEKLSAAWGDRLIGPHQTDSALVEQFRRLAAVLHKAQSTRKIKIVMVTSATPADGKTMTAVNLAMVLSGSYKRRVLLIDADLRRPTIGEAVGCRNAVGLSEALKDKDEQKVQLVEITPTLTLLPAGQPDPDPLAGLTSPRMRHILDDAAASFDWVILDAPPVGLLADAGLMADVVQGTVFVVRAGHSQFPAVRAAIDALGRDRLLGIVLNGIAERAAQAYRSAYSYVPAESRP